MRSWRTFALAGMLAISAAGCIGQPPEDLPEKSRLSSQAAETVSTDPWGITLWAEDIRPTGMTLVIAQAGGAPSGSLEYGSAFRLEAWKDGAWEPVPDLLGGLSWTAEGHSVAMEEQVELKLSWKDLYGSLPAGRYRIAKEFIDFRGPGDYDKQTYHAEFEVQ